MFHQNFKSERISRTYTSDDPCFNFDQDALRFCHSIQACFLQFTNCNRSRSQNTLSHTPPSGDTQSVSQLVGAHPFSLDSDCVFTSIMYLTSSIILRRLPIGIIGEFIKKSLSLSSFLFFSLSLCISYQLCRTCILVMSIKHIFRSQLIINFKYLMLIPLLNI